MNVEGSDRENAVERADSLHAMICAAECDFFAALAVIEREALWKNDGARDLAHWLWMRYGVSDWKARRWIDAARALEQLPATSEAFRSGRLGIDKVVELSRFATPENEAELLPWAERVAAGAIRARADTEARRSSGEAATIERARGLAWWHEDEGRLLRLEGVLPAATGAIVTRVLDRLAARLPVVPGGERDGREARRADALVALCSGNMAEPDPDRAIVVVHVPVETLMATRAADAEGGCEIEGGGVIPAETARRLACSARIETVVEDRGGRVVGLGRAFRDPSSQMMRVLRHRDRGCVFPGCGSRRHTHAHHIRWWSRGGRTDLENLALVCGFHHRMVHEHGWRLERASDGELAWYRPDGRRYRAGPAPPTPDVGSDDWAVDHATRRGALVGV